MKIFSIVFLFYLGIHQLYGQHQEASHEDLTCTTSFVAMPENDISEYVQAMRIPLRKMHDSIYIPVVIHNLTWNNNGFLQDSIIYDIIHKTNQKLANRGAYFDPRGFDTHIRIRLVTKDPNGLPHNGIIHQENILASHEEIFEDHFDTELLWNPDLYLNIFFHQAETGRASFPWSTSGFQGILVNSKLVQNNEGLNIIAHELGHHFGLYHTFQDGCFNHPCMEENDMVCDTRPDKISFQPCMEMNSCSADAPFKPDPDNPFTEDGNDMVHNYMDGGFCRSAFTMGQIDRMHWALAKYKPKLINTDFTTIDNCSLNSTRFSSPMKPAIVGEEIHFLNKNPNDKIKNKWYVDGVLVSQNIHLTTTFNQAKVYTIRLESALVSGICKDVFWVFQSKIKVTCSEEATIINMPKSMFVDSCYTITLSNASDIQWTFENQILNTNNVSICPLQSGVQKLNVKYQQGSCSINDSFYFFAHDSTHIRQYFSGYKMPFAQDTSSTPLISSLEKIDEKTNVMFGAEYFNRRNIEEDTTNSFFRFWSANQEQAVNWELFHITQNDLSNDFDFHSSMQIFPTDMVVDSTGNIYFIAFERYSRFSDMSNYFVGRINTNGRVQWVKRILTPEIKISKGAPAGFAEIFLLKDQLYIQVFRNFYSLNLNGQLQKAITLKMNPDSLYAQGINIFVDRKSSVNKEKIVFFSKIILQNPEDYPSFDDELVTHINENSNILVTMNHDFDSVQSQYYSFPEIKREETLTNTAFRNGTLLFFKDSEGQLNSFFTLLYVDNHNQIIESKQYSIDGNLVSGRNFEQVEFYVLNNNQILVVTRIDNGKKLLYMRFDEKLDLLEQRIYKPDFLNEPSGTEQTSFKILDNNSSLLVDDGILITSHVDEKKQDKLYFHHLPLDSNHLQCDQIYLEVKKDTLPIIKPRTEPLITAVPVELILEDINLHIRKSIIDIGQADCISSYSLEDYYFGAIDTLCLDLSTMQYEIDICRNEVSLRDTITLSLYEESPLEYPVESHNIYQVIFEEKQKCKNIIIEEPTSDYYFLLNAKENYPSPFTLERTLFDAHQVMEYDYTNNILFVKGLNCLDTNTNSVDHDNNFILFPNPFKKRFSLESKVNNIIDIKIYSIEGSLVFHDSSNNKDLQVEVDLPAGIFFLRAQLNDGTIQSKKIFIAK